MEFNFILVGIIAFVVIALIWLYLRVHYLKKSVEILYQIVVYNQIKLGFPGTTKEKVLNYFRKNY